MATQITKQIKSLLNDEALRQALTKESLQEMLDELDSNEIVIKDLNDTINALNENEKKLRIQANEWKDQRDAYRKNLDLLTARVERLDEREKACSLTEIRNQFEKQRGDEMLGVVGMILKNSEFRKTVFDSKPVAVYPGTYDATGQFIPGQVVEQHETKVTTKEVEE